MSLPTVTAGRMREFDLIMVEEVGIDLARMTGNAGRSLADLEGDHRFAFVKKRLALVDGGELRVVDRRADG